MVVESTEKTISTFLLDITAKQKKRVEQIVDFLIRAEAKLLDGFDLDNLPLDQYGNLAKTVGELQKIVLDLMELMRKMVAGNTKIPQSGNDEEIEEMAYLLRMLEPAQLDQLKVMMMDVKPQLQLIKKRKLLAAVASGDSEGE